MTRPWVVGCMRRSVRTGPCWADKFVLRGLGLDYECKLCRARSRNCFNMWLSQVIHTRNHQHEGIRHHGDQWSSHLDICSIVIVQVTVRRMTGASKLWKEQRTATRSAWTSKATKGMSLSLNSWPMIWPTLPNPAMITWSRISLLAPSSGCIACVTHLHVSGSCKVLHHGHDLDHFSVSNPHLAANYTEMY